MTHGTTRLPSIERVPYLDIIAALNDSGNKLTLFCVNRDLTRDLRAKFDIAGFRSKPIAIAHSVYAESIYERNDEIHPDQVHPRDSSLVARPAGFNYQFRHASVTVIELQRASE